MSQPDLFVVCKNCGSEVSPYVTECPYCGQRVRKRAPKLERDAEDAPRAKQRRAPHFSGLRSDRIEGIAPDSRPIATIVLISISMVLTVVLAAGAAFPDVGGIVVPTDEQVWRYFTTAFVHDSVAYEFVVLVAVGIFGSMIERRFGALATVAVYVLSGAAGAAAAVAVELAPLFSESPAYLIQGANGAALGLLTAWLVDDRRAAAAGDDRGSDLTGVYVLAVVLVLLPVALTEASVITGVVGAITGALLGLVLGLFTRRAA